jgi:hypothetical protein
MRAVEKPNKLAHIDKILFAYVIHRKRSNVFAKQIGLVLFDSDAVRFQGDPSGQTGNAFTTVRSVACDPRYAPATRRVLNFGMKLRRDKPNDLRFRQIAERVQNFEIIADQKLTKYLLHL